jgi:hypothetical protein
MTKNRGLCHRQRDGEGVFFHPFRCLLAPEWNLGDTENIHNPARQLPHESSIEQYQHFIITFLLITANCAYFQNIAGPFDPACHYFCLPNDDSVPKLGA